LIRLSGENLKAHSFLMQEIGKKKGTSPETTGGGNFDVWKKGKITQTETQKWVYEKKSRDVIQIQPIIPG